MTIERHARIAVGVLAMLLLAPSAAKADEHEGELRLEQVTKIERPDDATNAEFGHVIALDGRSMAVGAPGYDGPLIDMGAVYVYRREEEGVWTLQRTIYGSEPDSGARFGSAIALSGDTLAVGAPGFDRLEAADAGAVFIFGRNRDGDDNWGELDQVHPQLEPESIEFGRSVSMANDWLAVGSADGVALYLRKGANPGWWIQKTLSLVSPPADFGAALGIISNKLHILTGGAEPQSGVVTVDRGREDDRWTSYRVTAFEPDGDGLLGTGDFAAGYDMALAGASGESVDGHSGAGAVYVFGTEDDPEAPWSQFQRIVSEAPSADAQFGAGIGLSDALAVIGEPGRDAVAEDAGGASIYYRYSSRVGRFAFSANIEPVDLRAGESFGKSVLLYGSRAVVASDDAVYVFDINHVPDARDDAYTTDQRTPITLRVLENDRDKDGRLYSTGIVSHPDYGVLSTEPAGAFRFEPDPLYIGDVSFEYAIYDDDLVDFANVDITIEENNAPPVAVDDVVEVQSGEALEFDPTINDTDPDGDEPRFTVELGSPSPSSVIVEQDRVLRINEVFRDKTITYIVSDGYGGSDTGTVTVEVVGSTAGDAGFDARDPNFEGSHHERDAIDGPCICSSVSDRRLDRGWGGLAVAVLLGLALVRRRA